MKIVGIEKVDYKSKKTDRQVTGFRFHCVVDRDIVGGLAVESIFASSEKVGGLLKSVGGVLDQLVGKDIRVYYNRFGGVEELALEKA